MPSRVRAVRSSFAKLRLRWRSSGPFPTILMYHRIATPDIDPWGLAVGPERFEQQLGVLQRERCPLPMSEFVEALQRGTLPANAVAITFDDGYADNLTEARPRLASAGVPATLFLATGFVGQPHEYWWDELSRGILLRTEAVKEDVGIGNAMVALDFGETDRPDRAWRAWQQPRTERQHTYLTVWKQLRGAPAGERERAMVSLRALLEIPPPDPTDLPLNPGQLATLAADRLFEFGGHTATHPVLPALTPAQRRLEMAAGRAECERLVGKRIAGFAYPYGAFDDDTRAAAAACGFDWACSTQSRPVRRGTDRYALPRLTVLDWEAAAFARALKELRG